MELERIEKLMAKKSLTKAEKEEIKKAAADAGIEYTMKQGCTACWEKLLLKLYEHANGKADTVNVSKDGYRLRNPKAKFRIGTKVYSNATIGGEEVGKLNKFIVSYYFTKAEKSADTETVTESATETVTESATETDGNSTETANE